MKFADAPDVLTTTQAAELAQVHPDTIRELIHDGRLFAARVGMQWRIPKTRLGRFLGLEVAEPSEGTEGSAGAGNLRAVGGDRHER